MMLDLLDIVLKLVAAVILGGAVGWQRETHDRPAGLRTHILVCVGSAMYTLASMSFGPRTDPSRVAAQVATGMGFLGAGTIIRHGSEVRGLTTAASLWAVAAVGICVGLGREAYWIAFIGTILVLLTLTVLRQVEVRRLARSRYSLMTLQIAGGPERISELQKLLGEHEVRVESVQMSEGAPGEGQKMEIGIRLPADIDLTSLMRKVSELPGFISVRCG